jgi:hypothetical protein
MKPGDTVSVRSYPDKSLDRIVVKLLNNKVFVCTSEEWERAISENRTPDCIGFPPSDVKLIA